MIAVDGVEYDLTDAQLGALAKLYRTRGRVLLVGNASRAVNARVAHSLAALDLVAVDDLGSDGYPPRSRRTARLTEVGAVVCEAFTRRSESLARRER